MDIQCDWKKAHQNVNTGHFSRITSYFIFLLYPFFPIMPKLFAQGYTFYFCILKKLFKIPKNLMK